MGNANVTFKKEDLEALQQDTSSTFTPEELKQLQDRFAKLDVDGTGVLTAQQFLQSPDLASNPLIERVLPIFDKNRCEQIEFREFISALSTFSEEGNSTGKLRFAFQLYDTDGDGYISNGELFDMMKLISEDQLTDVQIQQIVDKTMLDADLDGDGMLSFEEFARIAETVEEVGDDVY